jgi:ribosome maturation factor RimP
LLSVSNEGVEIEVDRQKVDLPFADIGKARLAPLS